MLDLRIERRWNTGHLILSIGRCILFIHRERSFRCFEYWIQSFILYQVDWSLWQEQNSKVDFHGFEYLSGLGSEIKLNKKQGLCHVCSLFISCRSYGSIKPPPMWFHCKLKNRFFWLPISRTSIFGITKQGSISIWSPMKIKTQKSKQTKIKKILG